MVRINLLKNTSRKRSNRKPFLSVKVAALITVVAVLISGGGFLWRTVSRKPESVEALPQRVSDFKPSTHAKSNIVEEVVRELNDSRSRSIKSGILDIPYQDMTFSERVNYEVLFCKNVFEMLSRVIPSGIGLKTLDIDNFQTIYAVGMGDTKELVTSTFTALKNEKLQLLQKPYSYITSNAGKGFRFVVTCKTEYGLDAADPFQAINHIPAREDLAGLVRKISDIATLNDVTFRTPSQISAEKVGAYRRFVYQFSGTSTYKDFVRLILQLHKDRIPCAFKKVNLKARNGSVVQIDADILITLKE